MKSYSLKKGFSWPAILFGVIVFTATLLIFTPLILHPYGGNHDRTKALANAKSVVGGLLAFKSDKGAFPCKATREILEDEGIDFLPPGNNANAYLAQLVATDNIDTEKAFFAPGVIGAKEGDNIKGSADKLLSRGENSFAYIMAPDEKPLTDTRDSTPLVLAPVRGINEQDPTFDGGPYGDKFIMGLTDGSSVAGDLDENGHALAPLGGSLFQSGPDSLFGNDIPVVKYPLFRKR